MALSRLGDPADPRCVAVLARDANGELKGLLSFVPWGRRGLSLDLMRRDRAAENGITEFMVAGLVDACRDLGIVRISLNFAMFRGIFSAAERVGAGPVMRLTGAVLSVASKFWQLESLYRSNAKYLPRWVPRYMCHSQSMNVTRAAIAAGVAEGFLPGKDPIDSRGPGRHRHLPRPQRGAVRGGGDSAGRGVAPSGPTGATADRAGAGAAPQDRDAGVVRACRPTRWGSTRSTSLAAVRAEYPDLAPDTYTARRVSVAGRVRAVRDFGGVGVRPAARQRRSAPGHVDRSAHRRDAVRAMATNGRPRRLRQRQRRSSDWSIPGNCRLRRKPGRWPPSACVPCLMIASDWPTPMPGSGSATWT